MTPLITEVRQRLTNGPLNGMFCKTRDPMLIEALGACGLDFAILDCEHGANDLAVVGELIRAAELAGILPIVRVPEADPSLIGKYLDLGAGGVQIPNLRDAATARACVAAARFAPLGNRGVCRFVRAASYGRTPRQQYFSEANQALVILQVEGSDGIAALDDILAIDGCDILFIGPYDLSQSLGFPGEIEHPAVLAAIQDVVQRCAAKNRAVGIFADNPHSAARWRNCGVRYLATGVDVAMFADAASAWGRELRTPA